MLPQAVAVSGLQGVVKRRGAGGRGWCCGRAWQPQPRGPRERPPSLSLSLLLLLPPARARSSGQDHAHLAAAGRPNDQLGVLAHGSSGRGGHAPARAGSRSMRRPRLLLPPQRGGQAGGAAGQLQGQCHGYEITATRGAAGALRDSTAIWCVRGARGGVIGHKHKVMPQTACRREGGRLRSGGNGRTVPGSWSPGLYHHDCPIVHVATPRVCLRSPIPGAVFSGTFSCCPCRARQLPDEQGQCPTQPAMAAVAVAMPQRAPDSMQIDAPATSSDGEDLYSRLKTLQRQLEFLEIQVGGCWGRPRPHGPPGMGSCPPHAPDRAPRRRSTSRRSRRTSSVSSCGRRRRSSASSPCRW